MVSKSIDQWAQNSSLKVASFKPQWLDNEEDSLKLECRVASAGDINSISRFLYEMEIDPLPLLAEEIELSAQDDKGEKLVFSMKFSGIRAMDIKIKPQSEQKGKGTL